MRARVKYCGITRLEDALYAAELGVDALGFVFYAPSPRAIAPSAAAAIIDALPPFVTTVGLFVDAAVGEVESVVSETRLDLLQYHGNESGSYCERGPRPYIKALKIRDRETLRREIKEHPDARGILIDSYVPGTAGGTGKTFNWNDVPADVDKPLIVAGGLTVDNVGAALDRFEPYGLDVSSGIESEHGIKDADKMRQFMTKVNNYYGQR